MIRSLKMIVQKCIYVHVYSTDTGTYMYISFVLYQPITYEVAVLLRLEHLVVFCR